MLLPEGLGYAEFVNEPPATERGSDPPTALVVYFLQADGKSPLSPPPSEVKARVEVSGSRQVATQTLEMKPEPKSDDASGGVRFTSKPGPFQLGNIRGSLSGKAQGKAFKLEIAQGR